MKKFEETILERLQEIQEVIDGTLNKTGDFTVTIKGNEGTTYTHDREKYLQLGMEVAVEELQSLIEDIEERIDKKSKFKSVK